MKLLKVTVPNFRNLQNVELTFEPSLQPSVFPIGSENGGGKSTLLQLIFVLLTCWKNEEKKQYLENFLSLSHEINGTIAKIAVLYKGQEIEFVFSQFSSDTFNTSYDEIDQEYFKFTVNDARFNKIIKSKKKELIQLQEELKSRTELLLYIDDYDAIFNKLEIDTQKIKKRMSRIKHDLNMHVENIEKRNSEVYQKNKKLSILFSIITFKNEKDPNSGAKDIVLCRTHLKDYDLANEALEYASNHFYLATPSTQPYLFFDEESKRQLLTNFGEYQIKISELRETLPNIYSYNQLAITEIINAFKIARDKDLKQKLETGEYGTSFDSLLAEYRDFLGNDKYLYPEDEHLTSITIIREVSKGEAIAFEPEDLSHGELKRLGLYSWIKYGDINDSIILIDEIENGLHPDWQYNIVRDLAEWGDNQYLLATHSFYLCEALTPRHVKIIEPKLLNPSPENNDTSEP